MVKTNPLGALAATAGTLVAVGLLMLMLLAVEVRPAEAAGEVGGFNVTNNTTNDHAPSYSPSGEKIAYRVARSDALHSDIYTINVGGAGRFNVTDDRKNERDPSYSPDGEKIAYSGWDGQDWEIYTINADGGERVQLTDNTTNETELAYSPDGLKIAYEGYDGPDTEIYTINADGGGEVVQVTHNDTKDTDPTYSPSGTKIAYSGFDGRDLEIYTQHVGGGERIQLTNNTTGESELSYSPDGLKIAYVGREINSRNVKKDMEIFTLGLGPARRVVQVTHNTSRDGEPSYSPDGEKIAYEGYDGQDTEIYTINADGDTIAPKIVSVMPARGATGVLRGVNLKATFSEPVYDVKGNFKLYRNGSTKPVTAEVAPVEGTNNTKWVLNPNRSLRAGTTYTAKILTDVKDKAGNNLDQNRTMAGDQPMGWSFKTRS
jgi:dipeptidyl aminopeptidase/acylaminoacyl peptidase